VTAVSDFGYELTFTNMSENGYVYRPLCKRLTVVSLSLGFVKYQRDKNIIMLLSVVYKNQIIFMFVCLCST
jgi:hypothetical protein